MVILIPASTPVERFVREVLPSVPGGPRKWPTAPPASSRIRRAAKDRGLSAKKVAEGTYFFDGRRAVGGLGLMETRLTSLVGRHAVTICDSKDLTRHMLQLAGLPIPRGIALSPDQFDEALEHVKTFGPSVLKPSCGREGRGVTCGITSREHLEEAWDTAAKAVRKQPPLFVLEELVQGIDIRVLVLGRRFVAATTRLPALVVGDGHRSIAELVKLKQRWRAENAYLETKPLTVDEVLLARTGKDLGDVPAAGEVVILQGAANVANGGENVDVTELIHPDLSNLAVSAADAIPGLNLAGVDLISRSLDSADDAIVLEINAGPDVEIHQYPAYGKPRDVTVAIIDEMLATAGVGSARSKFRRRARRVARAVRRRVPGTRRRPLHP